VGGNDVQAILARLGEIREELDTCAGVGELDEVKNLVLGGLRMQNMIGIMVLEMACSVLGSDKASVIQLAVNLSKSGEMEQLLAQAGGTQGKAG
jgi:hypothetical protein